MAELAVQAIELAVYVAWVRRAPASAMARVRYVDWFATTPLMLATNAAYMAYAADRACASPCPCPCGPTLAGGLAGFVAVEAPYLAAMAAANLGMLLAGYAAELGRAPRGAACAAGFGAMGISFGVLWRRYARHSAEGRRLFAGVALVWSLYGAAFWAPPVAKNAAYNGLDVLAKNAFGLFLAAKVATG